jgi:hypothetical protein
MKKFKLFKIKSKYVMELEGFRYPLTKTQVMELALNVEHPYMVLTPKQYLLHHINTYKSKSLQTSK